jgi:large subunit ribosomal protein L14e
MIIEVSNLNLTLGQVVYSKAGRDAGKGFIVIEILDDCYVLISDGDLRRIEKPKKKKVKHLEPTKDIIATLGQKLENKLKVSNSDMRKALAEVRTNFNSQ